MDVMLKFVLNHKGIGLVPSFIARELVAQGLLVQIFKGYQTPSIPVSFVTAPQKEIPLKVKRFMEFASNKLASHFN
jgi:DNA-binding transcriptional LysR family regulator